MRPYQQLASVLFAALGVFLIVQGVELRLEGDFGPGPGFMAFLVGALLLVCSVIWGARTTFAAATPIRPELLPDRDGVVKVLAIIAALAALAAVFTLVGFKLAIFAFLLTAQFVFGRDHPWLKLVVAAACSFGIFLLFERVLRAPLPPASIEALAAFGL